MTLLDLETIRRAQAGDEDAARTIIERLHRPIIATLYRFLGPRYRSEYEDLAQEIFLKLFRSIDRFDPDRGVKFTTWTFTFVRNHCFDVLKKRRLRTTSLSVSEEDGETWDLPDPGAEQAIGSMQNRELGRKIEEALADLGDDQRMAFILREYEGLDYRTIAEVMDVSEGTIKSRLNRAKEALSQRLGPYLRTGS